MVIIDIKLQKNKDRETCLKEINQTDKGRSFIKLGTQVDKLGLGVNKLGTNSRQVMDAS